MQPEQLIETAPRYKATTHRIWRHARENPTSFPEHALHDALVMLEWSGKLNQNLNEARSYAAEHELLEEDDDAMAERVALVRAEVAASREAEAWCPKLPPKSAFTSEQFAMIQEQHLLDDMPNLSKVALYGRQKILRLAAEPIRYVWQDIAVAGTIILISGPPAEGKTTLLFLILAGRLNYGEPVPLLGRELLPAPPGKYVVVIEGEHSEHSTSRKLVKSFQILGLDDAGLDRVIIVARKSVLLGSPEWLDVIKLVKRGLVSDIALDTIARVAPADANDEREQVAIFAQIAKAIEAAPAKDTQPLAWAVVHNRKNGDDSGLGAVSGSAQRTGQADTVLMVKGEKVGGQTVSSTVTFQKLREDPDDYPKPATFAIVPREGGGWCVKGECKPADDRPLEVRIMELIKIEPLTKTKLGSMLGRSNADVDEAITNLFSTREITTTDVKVNGRSYKAFTPRRSTGRAPDEAPDPDEHRTSTGLN